MPRTPSSSAFYAARRLLNFDAGWLTFVEIQLASGNYVRLVENPQHLRANGVNWQACDMKVQLPLEDIDGTLGNVLITVPNVSREVLRLVEVDELLGRPLVAWIANAKLLDSFDAAFSWSHVTLDATASEKTATVQCGHPAEQLIAPGPTYRRSRFRQLVAGDGLRLGAS